MNLVLPLLVICIVLIGLVNVQLFFLPSNDDSIINEIEIIKLLIQDIDLDIHHLSENGLK